ncbi:MAG: sulfotransferase, partial [Dokdonella sp.]
AAYFERVNRLDEARALLAQIDPAAITREGLTEDSKVVSAQIAARGDDLDLALRLHEALVVDLATARRNPELMPALGRLYDKRGETDLAMSWFQRAHALQIEELRVRSPKWFEPGADPLDITRYRVDASSRQKWIPVSAPDMRSSPIFVLGFPRSGTTMLETMLDAHPDLAGMDERAFLHEVVDEIRKAGMTYPEDIGNLDDAMCEKLRGVYWNLVHTRTKVDRAKRLVDKNPLNILRLPLIARLFPNAKIILALRHPCDVVLSNFMQTFRTPAYIAITATIESTARGYADTFDFWLDQAEVLHPDVLEVRYEDVVDDIDAQSRRIAEFLGIAWHEAMVDFHIRAKARGYISTPSYHQVVEPINRKGVARWERYRHHLDPAIPLLQRYLERWNYQAGAALPDSNV